MYDDKTIKKIVKKVCEDCKVSNNIHLNGERAEGYSFIVTGMTYSWVINKIMEAINEAYPENDKLGGWRIQNGKCQLPCPGIKDGQEDDCMEIRLLWENYEM